MNGIVIYFEFGGTAERFAKKIADKCCFYTQSVRMKRSEGNISGKFNAEFEDFEVNYDNYDIIVFGFPVELNSFMPALKRFYGKYPLRNKKIAAFSVNTSGKKENFLRQAVIFFRKNKILKAQRFHVEKLSEESVNHLVSIFCRGLY